MIELRRALTISYASVAWSVAAGSFSVYAGLRAGSTALLGTGTDLLADLISSVVLVWRFRLELHGGRPGHEVEARAHVVAALALMAVAAGVAASASVRLASGHGASPDAIGIATAAASLAVLPLLAVAKRRIAAAVPSPALRTDAAITLVGAGTAALSLIGLLLTETLDWTAADPAAALAIAALAAWTGVRELRGR